jgi:N6-L-threonylcarbamoyladenine synthase
MEDTFILGIETSCDETAASIVKNGKQILSNVINSQANIHAQFGGVVPEVASRKHIENIALVVDQAFIDAGLEYQDIDGVAVTNRPGLIGALLVGVSFAKGLAWALDRPLLAVNHLHGHIYANFLEHQEISFPAVCLVVSGGHTSLLLLQEQDQYETIGETRDDAAGEAFDKVARFLGLGYPGGPAIQKAAEQGQAGKVRLPRVYLDRNDFEFSFSGLKTAAMNTWKKMENGGEIQVYDLAAEFQQALVEVLSEKAVRAAERYGAESILIAGGVAANQQLRRQMQEKAGPNDIKVYYPSLALCTDNAAMIAGIAYQQYVNKSYAPLELNAYPGLSSL